MLEDNLPLEGDLVKRLRIIRADSENKKNSSLHEPKSHEPKSVFEDSNNLVSQSLHLKIYQICSRINLLQNEKDV